MDNSYIFWIIFRYLYLRHRSGGEADGQGRRLAPGSAAQYVRSAESFLKAYELDWKPEGPFRRSRTGSGARRRRGRPVVTEFSSKLNDPDIDPKEISKMIITDRA